MNGKLYSFHRNTTTVYSVFSYPNEKKKTRTRLRFSVTIAVSFCYMFLLKLSKSSQLLSSNQG